MTELHAYIQSWQPRRFVRGVSDCCAFVAGWVELRSGRPLDCRHLGKPLADIVAAAILEAEGGLEKLVGSVLEDHGWQRREHPPRDGDAVVAHRNQAFHAQYVGIWSAGRLLTIASDGSFRTIAAGKVDVKGAWYGN